MEALLKLNDRSVLSEELSVQAGITLQFFDFGFRIDFVGVSFCSTELTPPVRVLLSSFPVAESKSILVGFSFGFGHLFFAIVARPRIDLQAVAINACLQGN